MAATVNVRQANQLVAGPDDLLYRRRGGHRRRREPFDVASGHAGHEQLRLGVRGQVDGAAAGGAFGLAGRRWRRVGNDLAGGGFFVDRALVEEAGGARGNRSGVDVPFVEAPPAPLSAVPPVTVVEPSVVEPSTPVDGRGGGPVGVDVEVEERKPVEVPPETLAVPCAHTAAGAAISKTTILTSAEPRARTRKTASSFVGLRG